MRQNSIPDLMTLQCLEKIHKSWKLIILLSPERQVATFWTPFLALLFPPCPLDYATRSIINYQVERPSVTDHILFYTKSPQFQPFFILASQGHSLLLLDWAFLNYTELILRMQNAGTWMETWFGRGRDMNAVFSTKRRKRSLASLYKLILPYHLSPQPKDVIMH